MPVCKNCRNKWTWTQSVMKQFTLRNGMICDYCKERQYLSSKSRYKNSILTALIAILLIVTISLFNLAIFPIFILIAMGVLLTLIITPFTMELSNHKETI